MPHLTDWLVRLFDRSAEGTETRRLDAMIDFWFRCHPMKSFLWTPETREHDACH